MSDESDQRGRTVGTWSAHDVERLGAADEVEVSSHRADGTLRPAVTTWGVRLGGDFFVRSAHGPDNGWFRRARTAGTGRLGAPGVDHDVVFEVLDEADDAVHARLDAAYHAKYDRYGPSTVGSVVGPVAAQATLRVAPRD